jgi:hypothetical protein
MRRVVDPIPPAGTSTKGKVSISRCFLGRRPGNAIQKLSESSYQVSPTFNGLNGFNDPAFTSHDGISLGTFADLAASKLLG